MDLPKRTFHMFIKRELTYALSFFFIFIAFLVLLAFVHGPFHPNSLLPATSLFFSRFLPSNRKPTMQHSPCDFSRGRWVHDHAYPLQSYTEACQFLDPGFRCHENGRQDEDFRQWRWQPDGCKLPSFNARNLLEMSRNGRIVFVGDSLGRNQWESLVCMLATAVSNQSTIYEENGKPINKHKGFLSMRFHDYNLTVEYYRAPFLVFIGRPPPNSSHQVRSALMLDQLHPYSKHWVGADVLVFNAGHWWNQDKTMKMGVYFHEGGVVNMTMDVIEAFRRSLQTWKSWAIKKLDPERSHIFFRSFSPVHYRGGTWNAGGRCDADTAPETNYTKLEPEPTNDQIISEVIKEMEDEHRPAQFLNISYLSEFRKDGHPSTHREPGTPVPIMQDCSHWCLPGVPDTWNGILYAHLLSNEFRTGREKIKTNSTFKVLRVL